MLELLYTVLSTFLTQSIKWNTRVLVVGNYIFMANITLLPLIIYASSAQLPVHPAISSIVLIFSLVFTVFYHLTNKSHIQLIVKAEYSVALIHYLGFFVSLIFECCARYYS